MEVFLPMKQMIPVSYTHLDVYKRQEAGRGKVVTFENTPLSAIIVKKVDSSTGDPLQGAWFLSLIHI